MKVALATPVNNKRMKRRYSWWGGCLVALALVCVACGSSKSVRKGSADAQLHALSLSDEEQRKFDYLFLEATRVKEKGEFDTAYELYNRCLELQPNSAVVLYELAHFHLYLNQPDWAQGLLEKAVQLSPDNLWYRQSLAAFYQQRGLTAKAIDAYEQIASQFPKRSDALVVLVDLYGREKRYADVVNALDRLEVKEGKSEQISMEKFRMYQNLDDKEKAFNEIESLAKEYPNDLHYQALLGDTYLNNERVEEAYDVVQSMLREEPDNTMAQLLLASYYEKCGQDSLYRTQMDTVLLNPKLDTSTKLDMMRQVIIRAEQAKQDTVKVMSLFRQLMAQETDNADLSMLCAQYLASKQMGEEVLKPVLNHILSIEPDNTAARLELLRYAVKKDDYNEAITICRPATDYNPEILEFYYYLGVSYYQTDQKDEALLTFQRGLKQVTAESDKNLVSTFYEISGDIYYQKQQKEKAFESYDSCLVYNSANISALNNYAYYLSLSKEQLDKAEEMSYRTVKAEPNNGTYLDTYAWILFEKERYSEARIYIDEAMKNGAGDDSSTVLEHCGDIYYMCGEKNAALDYWKRAAALEHDSKTLDKKIKQKRYIAE